MTLCAEIVIRGTLDLFQEVTVATESWIAKVMLVAVNQVKGSNVNLAKATAIIMMTVKVNMSRFRSEY